MTTIPKRMRKESDDVDYFSTLRDDCLYSIFGFLDCADCDQLKSASRKLSSITRAPAAKPGKCRASLNLTRQLYGYWANVETRHSRKVTYEFTKLNTDIDFNELHIHDELLENLPKIFHKYNLDELSMSDIIFGKHFVPKFTPYLKSTLKEGRLEMTVKEIDPSVTFTSIEALILATKTREVYFGWDSTQSRRGKVLFGPEFLHDWVSACPDRPHRLRMPSWTSQTWIAPSKLLPVLCNFSKLQLVSMILEPNDLIDLIIMRLNMEGPEASLEFCVQPTFTNVNFEKINFRLFKTEVTRIGMLSEEGTIKKIGTKFEAKYTIDKQVNKGRLFVRLLFRNSKQ